MILNVSSWYRRKWKVYIPTDEEAKFNWWDWLRLILLILLIVYGLYKFCNM